MNVKAILTKNIALVTPGLHKTRRAALQACVYSLLSGSSATVTAMGRGIASKAREKHCIKQADRLLSNTHLQQESSAIYQALIRHLLQAVQRPVILVDWSDMDPYKRHFLLRAALAFRGRSLTLYEEVHDITTKEKPETHARFLQRLSRLLPNGCRLSWSPTPASSPPGSGKCRNGAGILWAGYGDPTCTHSISSTGIAFAGYTPKPATSPGFYRGTFPATRP